jgi:serine/threonine protein kinase
MEISEQVQDDPLMPDSSKPRPLAPADYPAAGVETSTKVQRFDRAAISLSNLSADLASVQLQNEPAQWGSTQMKAELKRIRLLEHVHIDNFRGWYDTPAKLHRVLTTRLASLVMDEQLEQYLERYMQIQSRAGFRLPSPYVENIKKWFMCLASGLRFLHSHKICHGGLNPANIICHGDRIYYPIPMILQDEGDTIRKDVGPQYRYVHEAYAAPESSKTRNTTSIPSRRTTCSLWDLYTPICSPDSSVGTWRI